MAATLRCPECGADLPRRSPATVLVVCAYCRNAVVVGEEIARSAGTQSVPAEGFTRLYRGAMGTLGGQRFEVLGRARYAHRRGTWDEWFVRVEPATTAWITEDDHELAVQSPLAGVDLSFAITLAPGARFTVQGTAYEVDEIGETHCLGVEGELPKEVLTGQRYRYVDASSLDGKAALGIELDRAPPTAFLGRWLAHEDVRLDDEGDAW